MSRLGKQVNLNNLAEDQYSLLKEGYYNVVVTKASEEANKAGSGRLIKLELDVLGPTNKGAKLFHRINYIHNNPDTQRIGEIELRQMIEAMGRQEIEDTDELLNQTFLCKVGIQDATEQYAAQNVIKRFMASTLNGAPVSRPGTTGSAPVQQNQQYYQPQAQVQPQAPQQNTVTKPNKKPWE